MSSPTAPVITSTGISAPTYAQILAYLQNQYYSIFGADAYISPDSQDGQLLAVFAQAISDANSTAIAIYNSFSPATAQGAGLSNNVQINGLSRLVPTNSTAVCTLIGAPGAIIANGSAIDAAGNIWTLPTPLTFSASGTISGVLATCQAIGAVNLAINSLTINTPTYGWTGITNAVAAIGNPTETDAALRVRQAQSVSLPSVTIFEGIVAAIAQVPGVTRVKGYENNTSTNISIPGGYALPAGNLYFAVEGGASAAIAQAIFSKITPGVPTWGTSPALGNISTTITDTTGSQKTINYAVATETSVPISVTVHALAGWASTSIPLIQAALQAYLNTVPIGGNISYFGLVPIAQLPGTPQYGTFEVTGISLNGANGDFQLPFYAAASGATSTITVAVS